MGKQDYERVEVTSRAQWRAWLAAHHDDSVGIWLVTYKKHCGDRYLPWGDLVAEALCFGWVDSQTRRVDDDRTSVLVTPRKAGSAWSRVNKQHVADLEAAGLMTDAGRAPIAAAKADGSWVFLDDVEARIVPDDLAEALASRDARANWDAFPPSAQKVALEWIKRAKREATRTARITQVADGAARGERVR
jgi:uncharacterized protein YdeI (YjbR/CyaY-like superfamily)